MLHPETEARARELATAYRLLDRFETWLRDPRIRAQALEEAQRERRAVRPSSKRAGAEGLGQDARASRPNADAARLAVKPAFAARSLGGRRVESGAMRLRDTAAATR